MRNFASRTESVIFIRAPSILRSRARACDVTPPTGPAFSASARDSFICTRRSKKKKKVPCFLFFCLRSSRAPPSISLITRQPALISKRSRSSAMQWVYLRQSLSVPDLLFSPPLKRPPCISSPFFSPSRPLPSSSASAVSHSRELMMRNAPKPPWPFCRYSSVYRCKGMELTGLGEVEWLVLPLRFVVSPCFVDGRN